jgi:hypothetical protein
MTFGGWRSGFFARRYLPTISFGYQIGLALSSRRQLVKQVFCGSGVGTALLNNPSKFGSRALPAASQRVG